MTPFWTALDWYLSPIIFFYSLYGLFFSFFIKPHILINFNDIYHSLDLCGYLS